MPMPSQTKLERIVSHGHAFKRRLFREWKNGQNVFRCHGRSRAFSKKIYKQIVWPDDCVEDAYSYLFVAKRGFSFHFVSRTAVYFRTPQTFYDYVKQSSRFLQSEETLRKHLGADFIKSEYQLPRLITIKIMASEFLRHPFLTLGYIGLHILSRVAAKFMTFHQSRIEPSITSKKLTTDARLND